MIRWFDPAKCYGFIEAPHDSPKGTPDVFFYLTAVQKPFELSALRFSTRVEYEVVESRRGPRATKVWIK